MSSASIINKRAACHYRILQVKIVVLRSCHGVGRKGHEHSHGSFSSVPVDVFAPRAALVCRVVKLGTSAQPVISR